MHANFFDFSIRVLVYPEDGGIVAHALEMDLVGFGHDEKSAHEKLMEMIEAQLSFASAQNNRGTIFHGAPPELFARWEQAHTTRLQNEISGSAKKMNIKATTICLTSAELRKTTKPHRFQQLTESAFAEA